MLAQRKMFWRSRRDGEQQYIEVAVHSGHSKTGGVE